MRFEVLLYYTSTSTIILILYDRPYSGSTCISIGMCGCNAFAMVRCDPSRTLLSRCPPLNSADRCTPLLVIQKPEKVVRSASYRILRIITSYHILRTSYHVLLYFVYSSISFSDQRSSENTYTYIIYSTRNIGYMLTTLSDYGSTANRKFSK